VLDALPPTERATLLEGATVVQLERRQTALIPGMPFGHVDFPTGAMISVVVVLTTGETTEVAVVGREGFVPVEPVIGQNIARRSAFCQISGEVIRIPRGQFVSALESSPTLRTLTQRVLAARLFMTEQLIACNVSHTMLERCARWLLTTRDRVGRDQFALTHEFLSLMLGVRRASVTQAASELQRRGAIRYGRGEVIVIDDARLSALACECYPATREATELAFVDVDSTDAG
jgi:CRP-like cAMP-binding protein